MHAPKPAKSQEYRSTMKRGTLTAYGYKDSATNAWKHAVHETTQLNRYGKAIALIVRYMDIARKTILAHYLITRCNIPKKSCTPINI